MPNRKYVIRGLFIAFIAGFLLIAMGTGNEDSVMIGLGILIIIISPILMVIGVIKRT